MSYTPLPVNGIAGPLEALALRAGNPGRLIVKFVDARQARATVGGGLRFAAGVSPSEVTELAEALDVQLRFRSLVQLPESELAALETRAASSSGRAQPDLAGMQIVDVLDADMAQLERVGQALNELADVEWAWIEHLVVPPPGDIAPTTPDLEPSQGWRDPGPGMDVDYAWSLGARGANVRLSDCEYGWDPDHEDLNDISLNLEPGQTIPGFVFGNNWDDHGTAALGEAAAQDNGYGCSGSVPDATFHTYPENSVEEGSRRVTAITNAIMNSAPGDVVLLEMQTSIGFGYGPAELSLPVWTISRVASDAGVIVVGAAGNGNQNLDSSNYNNYSARGDSGAILVGAGSPDANHSKLDFSTYGSRVNVQGWGWSVFTLGYGNFAQYGGDPNQAYRHDFNGTSSASPFVAGACVAIQSYLKAGGFAPLSPLEMRDLLIATGVPQGAGGHIGPFMDLRAALDSLIVCPAPQSYCATSPNSAGAGATIGWSGSTSLSANNSVLNVGGAPASVFGLFFYGAATSSAPFGDGVLCVAGGGAGLTRLTPSQMTDASGNVQATLDFTQPPFDSGTGEAHVGHTRNWQFWYRDPAAAGAGFNLSDALAVTYCP